MCREYARWNVLKSCPSDRIRTLHNLPILSKSDYMLFLRHPAWLWLKKFDKGKLPSADANLQAIFDAGHAFEPYAEQLLPEAVKLGFDGYDEYLSLPHRTQAALQAGAKTILQGRFEADGLTCIVDVLTESSAGVFDLLEIKASTRVKPEHEYDLAFQVLVLEKCGLSIRSISVMHANKEYVRQGEIVPAELITTTDVTDTVRALVHTTQLQVDVAQNILTQKTRPDLSPRYVNQLDIPGVGSQWLVEWLHIYTSLNPNLDPYSIYNLSYPSPEQLGELEDLGVTSIGDVPEEMALRPKQAAQIHTTKTNQRLLEPEKIRAFLQALTYPLYFFDYETLSSIIPPFDGLSPYKDYPFQYSLHVIEEPDGEVRHLEYLHSENTNPMPELLSQLKKDIGDTGTILTWNMSYEKSCNDRMATLYPKYAEFLADLNARVRDLMIPFSEMWLFDKDFFGSASLKKVLPVLVPELSYQELAVADGLLARRLWTETVMEGKHSEKWAAILSDLSQYCTLDTYAMVRIWEEMNSITKSTSEQSIE